MTFFIVLFIVLMQFLWRYINDLVGKGLSFGVLGELFFYAAVSMVPMALPLAILLASLMTFGNLGEKFELTAMKAAGLSLVQIMKPLIVLVALISVGAFFFQNDVLPKAQVKMWTLLFSVRQKSPEVEIPEGVFYDQIPGYNLFVEHKNRETGILYEVMIYDVSKPGDNGTILLADSARLAFTPDNKYLYLHLWEGEQFENLREMQSMDRNVPFRREEFAEKEILIPFDANFNRMDEGGMRNQYVGKNIAELRQTIDSIGTEVDSIAGSLSAGMKRDMDNNFQLVRVDDEPKNSTKNLAKMIEAISIDTLIMSTEENQRRIMLQSAVDRARNQQMEAEYRTMFLDEDLKSIRRHEIELMKKFTLSVACLVFFFIGAPLGAIIRKGGLGTPLVISVGLFLVYYIIDNTGYKLARNGQWDVWAGIWLSTFVLAPLGIYVTYKAMNDSAVFDKDAYIRLFRKLVGAKQNRQVEYKEIVMEDISDSVAIEKINETKSAAAAFIERYCHRPPAKPDTDDEPDPVKAKFKWQTYWAYFLRGYDTTQLHDTAETLESTVSYLSYSRDRLLVNKLMDYPILSLLWIYRPARRRWLSYTLMAVFPVGIPLWLIGTSAQRRLIDDMRTILTVSDQLLTLLPPASSADPADPAESAEPANYPVSAESPDSQDSTPEPAESSPDASPTTP